jgi:hypothetical protein
VTKSSDLLVAALESEGVACIFAIAGEETIFQFFCLAVFIGSPRAGNDGAAVLTWLT